MLIKEIINNKKEYLDILLIGDENEAMISKYLDAGHLFVLFDHKKAVSACVILQIDFDTVEIKNLATYTKHQNKGFASKLLDFVFDKYKNSYENIILGTGENEITLNFYKKRGFIEFKRIPNFFTENYPKPIFENGIQLIDMIYLERKLK